MKHTSEIKWPKYKLKSCFVSTSWNLNLGEKSTYPLLHSNAAVQGISIIRFIFKICAWKNNCVIIELVPDNLAKWESHNERGVIFAHNNPTVATHELKRIFIISVVWQLNECEKDEFFLPLLII